MITNSGFSVSAASWSYYLKRLLKNGLVFCKLGHSWWNVISWEIPLRVPFAGSCLQSLVCRVLFTESCASCLFVNDEVLPYFACVTYKQRGISLHCWYRGMGNLTHRCDSLWGKPVSLRLILSGPSFLSSYTIFYAG